VLLYTNNADCLSVAAVMAVLLVVLLLVLTSLLLASRTMRVFDETVANIFTRLRRYPRGPGRPMRPRRRTGGFLVAQRIRIYSV
jgi:hypothetical protein